jgi:hypothetical protein
MARRGGELIRWLPCPMNECLKEVLLVFTINAI